MSKVTAATRREVFVEDQKGEKHLVKVVKYEQNPGVVPPARWARLVPVDKFEKEGGDTKDMEQLEDPGPPHDREEDVRDIQEYDVSEHQFELEKEKTQKYPPIGNEYATRFAVNERKKKPMSITRKDEDVVMTTKRTFTRRVQRKLAADDISVVQRVLLAQLSPATIQQDTVMFTASVKINANWVLSTLRAVAGPDGDTAGGVVYLNPKNVPLPALGLFPGVIDMGQNRTLVAGMNVTGPTLNAGIFITQTPITVQEQKQKLFSMNIGDRIMASVLGNTALATGQSWNAAVQLVGIEPNPGPSGPTNKEMHAQNGNIDVQVYDPIRQIYSIHEQGHEEATADQENSENTYWPLATDERYVDPDEWIKRVEEETQIMMGALCRAAKSHSQVGGDWLRYAMGCVVLDVNPAEMNYEVSIPQTKELQAWATKPKEERERRLSSRQGRSGMTAEEKAAKKARGGWTPAKPEDVAQNKAIEQVIQMVETDVVSAFYAIAVSGAHDLLEPLTARLETVRGQNVNTLVEVFQQYLLGGYDRDDLIDDLSVVDKVLNHHLSRDFIRKVEPTCSTPSSLLEAVADAANRVQHTTNGNIDGWGEAQARGNNARQHATNGNTESGGGMPGGEGGAENPASMRTVPENDSNKGTAKPQDYREKVKEAVKSSVFAYLKAELAKAILVPDPIFNTSVNAVAEIVRQWAQVQGRQATSQNGTGGNLLDGYPEMWVGGVAYNDGTDYAFIDAYSIVSPTAGLNTKYTGSPATSAIEAATRVGDIPAISPILRVNTTVTDGDALQRMIFDSEAKMKSNTGGSSARSLLPTFLYSAAFAPLFTGENALDIANTILVLDNAAPLFSTTWYPMEDPPTLAQPDIEACICTYSDFCAIRWGDSEEPIAGFNSDQWGVTVAVVPIVRSNFSRGNLVAQKTLNRLAFPYLQIATSASMTDEAGNIVFATQSAPSSATNTRIPGPTSKVLFVLCDETNKGSTPNLDLTVGPPGATVLVNYPQESIFAASIDIGAALTATMADANWAQALSDSIEDWCKTVGSFGDYASALIAAADHAFQVPAPMVMVNQTLIGGLIDETASVPTWNTTDMNAAYGTANVDNKANGRTHPMDMFCTTALMEISHQELTVCSIGQLSPVTEVDVSANNYLPLMRVRTPLSQNLGAVVSSLRRIARVLSQMVDAACYDCGVNALELWQPNQGANVGGGDTGEINLFWTAMGEQMTLACREAGADTILYDYSTLSSRDNAYWLNEIGQTASEPVLLTPLSVGWARVPKHIISRFCDWVPPQINKTTKLGELGLGQGFPTLLDSFSILADDPPEMSSEKSEGWMVLANRAGVFQTPRPEAFLGNCNPTGAAKHVLGFPVTTPTYGVATAIALANFGVPNPLNFKARDPPLFAPIPIASFYLAQDYKLFYYGNDFSNVDRNTIQDHTMTTMKVANTRKEVRIAPAGGQNRTISKMAMMTNKKGTS